MSPSPPQKAPIPAAPPGPYDTKLSPAEFAASKAKNAFSPLLSFIDNAMGNPLPNPPGLRRR